jgi:hypothetical protein
VFAKMIAEFKPHAARQTFTPSKKSISRNRLASTVLLHLGKGGLDVTVPSSANSRATWHLFAGCRFVCSRHTSDIPISFCLLSLLMEEFGNTFAVPCPTVREPYSAYIAFAVIPFFGTRQTRKNSVTTIFPIVAVLHYQAGTIPQGRQRRPHELHKSGI